MNPQLDADAITELTRTPFGTLYALDIETDNSAGHGLDPTQSRITDVAISTIIGDWAFSSDDENALLTKVVWFLNRLPVGLVATWNGTFFDMPFLRYRQQQHLAATLIGSPGAPISLEPKYDWLPGCDTQAYDWTLAGGHRHVDAQYSYRAYAEAHQVSWSLKPVATAMGLNPVELDRTRLHTYTPQQVRDYVLSDARCTRELARASLSGLSGPGDPA